MWHWSRYCAKEAGKLLEGASNCVPELIELGHIVWLRRGRASPSIYMILLRIGHDRWMMLEVESVSDGVRKRGKR